LASFSGLHLIVRVDPYDDIFPVAYLLFVRSAGKFLQQYNRIKEMECCASLLALQLHHSPIANGDKTVYGSLSTPLMDKKTNRIDKEKSEGSQKIKTS